jgi:exodeoxyribonuclease V alpha subunit
MKCQDYSIPIWKKGRLQMFKFKGKAQIEFERKDGYPDELDTFFESLLSYPLVKSRMSIENLHLIWHMVELETNIKTSAQKSLFMVVLAAFIGVMEGSTRFPIKEELFEGELKNLFDNTELDKNRRIPLVKNVVKQFLSLIKSDLENVMDRIPMDQSIFDLFQNDDSSLQRAKPLIIRGDWLYLHKMLFKEVGFLNKLRDLITNDNENSIEKESTEISIWYNFNEKEDISGEKLDALQKAQKYRFSIVSGGPGTGKTSLILALMSLLKQPDMNRLSFALAAPTGKAAYRMSDALKGFINNKPNKERTPFEKDLIDNMEATTLHRLLGYSPKYHYFKHNKTNPLSAKVVIVDEASMVDIGIMEQLISSLRPDAKLIIFGDANQLPSVSSGAVLRDLVTFPTDFKEHSLFAALLARTTILKKNHRTISEIREIADQINQNEVSSELGNRIVHCENTEQFLKKTGIYSYYIKDSAGQVSESTDFLEEWYENTINPMINHENILNVSWDEGEGGQLSQKPKLKQIFANLERHKLLCVTNVFPTGTKAINSSFHKKHPLFNLRDTSQFLPGEPVMVMENDYDLNLFNGDTGIILNTKLEGNHVISKAVFFKNGNYRVYSLSRLKHILTLAYAVTVHKSQGSEYESVVLILPEVFIPLCSKELLYTAITRAKKRVLILGSKEVFNKSTQLPTIRYTSIKDALLA